MFINKYTCILTIYDKTCVCITCPPTVTDIFFYSKTYKSLPRQVMGGGTTAYLQWKQDLNSHRTFKSAKRKRQSAKTSGIRATMQNSVISKGGEWLETG